VPTARALHLPGALSRPSSEPEPMISKAKATVGYTVTRWKNCTILWMLLRSLLLIAAMTEAAAAQTHAGSITELRGSASIERSGNLFAAVLASPIMVSDKIETAERSSLTILLLDGSRLTLSDSTSMVVDRMILDSVAVDSRLNVLISLFRGQLESFVHSAASPHFEVHTPNAIAGVRGTDFKTAYVDGKPCPGFPTCPRYTDVEVYEGIVEVSNPANPRAAAVSVASGYETTVPCELPPAAPGPLGMSDLTAPGYH
jgi:ferric-dicitrate binding protein FerR (iron transport regulator)